MSEVTRIADQLRRSYEGDAWHGPSLQEVLNGVDEETAAHRGGGGVHTIWELVLHLTAWAAAARRAITGHPYVSLSGKADWPDPEGTWASTLDRFRGEQVLLLEEVGKLTDGRLDEVVSGEKNYSIYFLLHGMIQHNLYHAGQIQLLKKLM